VLHDPANLAHATLLIGPHCSVTERFAALPQELSESRAKAKLCRFNTG
jgi:hypothetical protein